MPALLTHIPNSKEDARPSYTDHRPVAAHALERNLLRRALVDATTGLPNTLYLDLLCSWESAVALRNRAAMSLLLITVDGSADHVYRALVGQLGFIIRGSDVLASDGPHALYLLCTMRRIDDYVCIAARIQQLAQRLNALHADLNPLTVSVRAVDY